MARLIIFLTAISLIASYLQVCLPRPVDIQREDEKPDSSGSGFTDLESTKNNMTGPDDEDYSGDSSSGSSSDIIKKTQEEIWKQFILLLELHGYKINGTVIVKTN